MRSIKKKNQALFHEREVCKNIINRIECLLPCPGERVHQSKDTTQLDTSPNEDQERYV